MNLFFEAILECFNPSMVMEYLSNPFRHCLELGFMFLVYAGVFYILRCIVRIYRHFTCYWKTHYITGCVVSKDRPYNKQKQDYEYYVGVKFTHRNTLYTRTFKNYSAYMGYQTGASIQVTIREQVNNKSGKIVRQTFAI